MYNSLTYEPSKGISFPQAVQELQTLQQVNGEKDARFMIFNEIRVPVHPDSKIFDICMIYDLKCEIRRLEKDLN